jgi:hypothetical protein
MATSGQGERPVTGLFCDTFPCTFEFHVLNDKCCWASFRMLTWLHISFWVRHLFRLFCPYFNWEFSLVEFKSSLCIIVTIYHIYDLQTFFPVNCLLFYSYNNAVHKEKAFNFGDIKWILFNVILLCLKHTIKSKIMQIFLVSMLFYILYILCLGLHFIYS